jgi:hypothetical protein
LLVGFAEYIGAELDFDKFIISLVQHRGNTAPKILSPNKNIKVVSQILDKRNRDEEGNPLISYTCTPIETDLNLGDEVLLIQKTLGIQERLRIVKIVTNPYDKADVAVEIANQIDTLEDEFYRIETSTVIKGKLYNNCSISAENGFMSVRSDGRAKMVANSTEGFSLFSGEISGSLARNFFVDTNGKIIAKKIEIDGSGTFAGDLIAAGGTFAGSITIGSGNDVFKANGSEGIWLGKADFDDAPFSVDLDGNLIAYNGKFVDGSISGSKFYGSNENSAYIKIGAGGQSNLGDFQLFRGSPGGNYPVFKIYDAISIIGLHAGTGSASPAAFLTTNGANTDAYGMWRFRGDGIGFFGATPVTQQTATLIPTPSTATAHDCAVKINGILEKLCLYGLFDIS